MFRKFSHLSFLNQFSRMIFRLSLLVFFLSQIVFSQTKIEQGKPLERELSGGQKEAFEIALDDSQYVKFVVAQRGIDVAIRFLDVDGNIAIEYDYDPRIKGEETVEFVSKTAGNYKLTIESRQKNAPKGRFEIRVIELKNATEKDFRLDEARLKITLATQLWRAGKYSDALPLAERALEIRQKETGAENFDVSQALTVIANIYSEMAEFEKSAIFYRRAMEMREKIVGKNDITLTPILNNFGLLYKEKGDYATAETLFLRTLAIREKELDANHLLIAGILNNLGIIYKEKGNIEKSAEFYGRALAIREKALGAESADVATTLNNIANLYTDVSKAEPLYLRALAIREKVLGPEHQDVSQTLYNMATLYAQAGDFAKAESFCRRSLAITENNYGHAAVFTSYPVNLLAIIYKNTGDYAKAVPLYLRAIAIKEKLQGAFHPHLGGVFINLANLYAAQGETEKAVKAQTRANEILEFNTSLNLATGSEKEKSEFLQTLSGMENLTLTLNFNLGANFAPAANLAATTILQRKGRVLDSMSDSLGALRRRSNPNDLILLDNLSNANTELVGFVLNKPEDLSLDEYQKQLKTLEANRENLESEISRRSAGFFEQSKPVTVRDVQNLIPPDSALIEFAVYRAIPSKHTEFSFDKLSDTKLIGQPRYALFVAMREGNVQWNDLGETEEIDKAIEAFRAALRDPKRTDVQKPARVVGDKIFAPIKAFLGNSTRLLISPDGALNLIPFEALQDENSKYLVEKYSITYLTSGRDLLRMQIERESKSGMLLMANPLFGAASADKFFAPLAGTFQEAQTIQKSFPTATLLTGKQATETALKQTAAPKILHIATHGFFLENNPKTQNPLVRAGLAFAGANERTSETDDGILTALEASGLNLWGTKLVVLSACDTGLGEVRIGEGVYGLRRAFVLAGTESLVMSLWSVSDYATRELMTNYYKNLKSGAGRGEALRQVQLEMLKKPNRQHPFYWASFIQSGEWANLEGKR